MYEINLITKDNNISIVDNRVDLILNEVSSTITINGETLNNISVSEVTNTINFNQTGIKRIRCWFKIWYRNVDRRVC